MNECPLAERLDTQDPMLCRMSPFSAGQLDEDGVITFPAFSPGGRDWNKTRRNQAAEPSVELVRDLGDLFLRQDREYRRDSSFLT
jgi:hypothetical protein